MKKMNLKMVYLAMVKNIVTSSGGHIGFESEQGKGTLFTLELPANQEKT